MSTTDETMKEKIRHTALLATMLASHYKEGMTQHEMVVYLLNFSKDKSAIENAIEIFNEDLLIKRLKAGMQ